MKEKVDFTKLDIPWPQGGERLIGSGDDWQMNACLNFGGDQAERYADGYKVAADVLVAHVADSHSDQDKLVFPVLYCYRHYVELRLKLIIVNARRLLDIRGKKQPEGHQLDKLWNLARPLIEKAYQSDPKVDIDRAEALIKQMVEADPWATAFRYSTERDGSPTLQGITHINLRTAGEVVNRLAGFLDSVDMGIVCTTDIKEEIEREMRSYGPGPNDY